MRLRSPTDLLDAAGMSGTMGGFDPFIEGDDASRRAAHEADTREKRVAAARRKWLEIPAERIETRRMAGKTFVVDTGGSGGVYEYVRVPVWASGDPRSGINDHVPTAFTIVDGDVVFLKDNAIGAKSGADLEQWQNDRAWLAARRQAKAELAAERVEQEHVQFRSKQALKTVTLSDLEGRDLPTVRAAAECIEECGGKLRAKDGRLVVSLPGRLSPRESDHDQLHAELMDCVRVLYGAGEVVVGAVSSGSTKDLSERLPDAHVSADGGLVVP